LIVVLSGGKYINSCVFCEYISSANRSGRTGGWGGGDSIDSTLQSMLREQHRAPRTRGEHTAASRGVKRAKGQTGNEQRVQKVATTTS